MARNTRFEKIDQGLFIRRYVRPDGSLYAPHWVWRVFWGASKAEGKTAKERVLPLGPCNMFDEKTARVLVQGFVTQRRAGRSFEEIQANYAGFLDTYAEGEVADAAAVAKRIADPMEASRYLAGASGVAQAARELAEAIRGRS